MPLATPSIKHLNVSRLGSKVLLHGQDFDEAKAECHRLQKLHGLIDIPPYDDPYVIAGQGTIAMEVLRQTNVDSLQAVFATVGGGGMIAGIASYVKRIAPHVRIIGVETYDACAMKKSLEKGERVVLDEVGLFADGAAVRVVGEETFRISKDLVDEIILVKADEICAAIKDVFEGTLRLNFSNTDTRSILEPAGALSVAGLKKYLSTKAPLSPTLPGSPTSSAPPTYCCILSGANMNFSRLRFIAERAHLGAGTEILFTVLIPEMPGTFQQLISAILPRAITEFSYRYNNPRTAAVYVSFAVSDREREKELVTKQWEEMGFQWEDISRDEMAKSHGRYLVGGSGSGEQERLYRFEFPERPGALAKFLAELRPTWNISLFHYRNHGHGILLRRVKELIVDVGKILAGIQVPELDRGALEEFLRGLGYTWWDETENSVYKRFMTKNMS
jgi:threonine dehydratase